MKLNALDKAIGRANSKAMTMFSREEVEGKLAASEARNDARLAQFETMMKTGFEQLRAEMAGQRAEMAGLRAEMHKNTADIIKWVVSTMLALGALIIVILTFVFNNALNKPAAPLPPPPQVIVVPWPGATPSQSPPDAAPSR